jgi:hypothetical protein
MPATATLRCFAFLRSLQQLTVAKRLDLAKFVPDAARADFSPHRAFAAAAKPAQRIGADAQDCSGITLGEQAVWRTPGNVSHVFESPLCDQKKNDKHALGVIAPFRFSLGEEMRKNMHPSHGTAIALYRRSGQMC